MSGAQALFREQAGPSRLPRLALDAFHDDVALPPSASPTGSRRPGVTCPTASDGQSRSSWRQLPGSPKPSAA